MSDRLQVEVEILRMAGWQVDVGPDFGWIVVKDVFLPEGWNREKTDVLIKIPRGYPTTPPDNFYCAADLRLVSGGKPGNAPQEETISGQVWLMFSFHVGGGWDPHADANQGHNLLTYLEAVRRRLSEAS